MTDYDRIITAIKADIEKQKETAVNPSARIFIGGEMRAIEIIEELKMESAGTQITNSNLKSESEIKVDLISREEAVECCFNGWNKGYKEIAEDIKKLPTYPANLVKESGVLVKDLVKDGDLISKKAVLDFTTEWCNRCGKRKEYDGVMCKCCDLADTIDFVEELPTYSAEQTENPTKDIDSAIEYWKSVDEDNNMVKWLTELQEYRKAEREKTEQTYDWCKGCKEYDTEKHCCHRYSSFIRESLQDNINAVLEDIKEYIEELPRIKVGNSNSPTVKYCIDERLIYEVFEKHISGKE